MFNTILYEGSIFSRIGGGSHHLSGLANALARTDLTVTVITPDIIGDIDLDQSITHKRLASKGSLPIRLIRYEIEKIIFLWKRRQTARETIYLTRLATLGVATWCAAKFGFNVIIEVNGPISTEIEDRIPYVGFIFVSICKQMERLQLRNSSKVVCVSSSLINYVHDLSPHSKIIVLPNGANIIASAENSQRIETVESRIVNTMRLCYLGAVTEWYDIELVKDAMGQLNVNSELHVIGDGPKLTELKSRKSDNVIFWGWLGAEETNEVLLSSDIGIIPANPASASAALRSPLKLYHYFSAGMIVVVADIIEVEPELLPYVVIYKSGDHIDLARALREAMDKSGAEMPKDLWSWDSRAVQLCENLGLSSNNNE